MYYYCTVKSDGTIAISFNMASDGGATGETLTIPAQIGGYTVSELNECYHAPFKKIEFESGSKLTLLGSQVFGGCEAETITLPDTVETIGYSAFINCSSLSEIRVDKNNKTYKSADGVLFSKDGRTLIMCPSGKKGKYEIPAGITTIGESAFSGCDEITSVTVPDGVTEILADAFSGCKSLEGIKLPESLKTLGERCFSQSGIISLSLSENITDIPMYAFGECGALKEIKLPKDLKTLGDYCFSNTAITSIDIPEGVSDLPGYAFVGCESLSEVKLHEGLKTIGSGCFGRTALKSLIIPESVTKIDPEWCKGDIFYEGVKVTKIETINGIAGSYAETFAKENGITFNAVSSVGGSGNTAGNNQGVSDKGTSNTGVSDKGTPEKGSPDTGVPAVAAAAGIAALAGTFMIISKKKR